MKYPLRVLILVPMIIASLVPAYVATVRAPVSGPTIFADIINDSSLVSGSTVTIQVHVMNVALPNDADAWQVVGHVSPRILLLADITPGSFLNGVCGPSGSEPGSLLFSKTFDVITGDFAASQACLAGPPEPTDAGATGSGVLFSIIAKVKGESVIQGPTPAEHTVLSNDARLTFRDINFGVNSGNGVWDPSESIYVDQNLDRKVGQIGEPVLCPTDTGCVAASTPSNGTMLSTDPNLKYINARGGSSKNPFEIGVYDSNGDGKYNSGEPTFVTLLIPLSSGTFGTGDPNLLFVDTDHDGFLTPDGTEPVVYDSNGDGKYNTGEPVIFGTAPADNTPLSSDPDIGFIDSNGDGVRNLDEVVVYDVQELGQLLSTSLILSSPSSSPPVPADGTTLSMDSKIKFVDADNSGHWNSGESVVYDKNVDGKYLHGCGGAFASAAKTATADPGDCEVVATRRTIDSARTSPLGSPTRFPGQNRKLSVDPKITYVDANMNGKYDCNTPVLTPIPPTCSSGETLVYDSPNTNHLYDVRLGNTLVDLDPSQTFMVDIDGFASTNIPTAVQDGLFNNSIHHCDFTGNAVTVSPRTPKLGHDVALKANLSCDSAVLTRVQFDIATPSGGHDMVVSPAVLGNPTQGVAVSASYTPPEAGFYSVVATALWSEDGGILYTYGALLTPQSVNLDFTVRG